MSPRANYVVSRQPAGFTLVEMVMSVAILAVAISVAMTGYLYVWSESNRSNKQDELDVEVQISAERIKRDLRLSALEKMYYYPPNSNRYTAISMPLARDDDGDGAVDLDVNGDIIWDKTVIYHVWSGSPNQLRKTTFDPRDNSLTATQMQAQLNSVALVGNGSSTYGSSNATSEVVFQNLFTWYVEPQGARYDGYSATTNRDVGTTLGSAILSNGTHTFRFTVVSNNPSSTGYKMGIDTLYMSPSASEREAEAQAITAVGVTVPTNVYMAGGSWSGNYHLSYPATIASTNRYFILNMVNDRWEETNFRATGELHDGTTVQFDTSLSPSNFVVLLEGNTTNWFASSQTGDPIGGQAVNDNVKNCGVRVLIRGKDQSYGDWIRASGGKVQVKFAAGTMGSGLTIDDAFIGEADSTNTMNVVGTNTRLLFGGAQELVMGAGGSAWSDMVDFPIDKEKSYVVSYLVNNAGGHGNAWRWQETNTVGYVAEYIIPAGSSPVEADIMANTWSTRADVYSTNVLHAVQYLFSPYPTNGVYTSAIYDTKIAAPGYSNITWNSSLPTGSSVSLKVRSGNSNNLADASGWTNIAAITTSGSSITPGAKRYVQFQASLRPPSAGTTTPKLLDTSIRWRGETKVVDIGGTFTKGPDFGIFELLVNGQPLKKGVVVTVEIFDYARAHGTTNRITSTATTEVTPRNTGK